MRLHVHFNPRSREGSDCIKRQMPSLFLISTHAPARGATDDYRKARRHYSISTHAPARGATSTIQIMNGFDRFQPTLPRGERRSSLFIVFYSKDNFNPRSREGSDKYSRVSPTVYSISTHAPARGATAVAYVYSVIDEVFQPTLPRGERRRRRG